MLQARVDEKKVVGGLFAGQLAGAILIEAASGEELSMMLQSLPFGEPLLGKFFRCKPSSRN